MPLSLVLREKIEIIICVNTLKTPSLLKSPQASPMTAATPMPNYEQMISPALRQELRRFGLKVIPRRKAVPLLMHIYDETHPHVRRKVNFRQSEEQVEEEEVAPSSQESTNSEDFPEESIDAAAAEDFDDNDFPKRLVKFIQDDPDLHRQALTYEPIWLEDLFQQFKEETRTTVKLNQVQDVLDNECITFRTRARHGKNQKRNEKNKR